MGMEMNKQNMRYIFLIGLLPVASAFAETAVQCHNLKDDALRLACYDRIFAVRLPDMLGKSGQHEAKSVLNLTETVRSSLDKKEAVIVVDEDVPSGDQAGATEATYTPLSLMYDLDRNDTRGLLSVREHNPMYLMPFWYNSSPNYSPSSPTRGITEQRDSGSKSVRKPNFRFRLKAKSLRICSKAVRICGSVIRRNQTGRFSIRAGNPHRSEIRIISLKSS